MRVQKNGKVRRSPNEWQKIFEQFQSSDLSESAFCRREKIPKSSFAKWKRRMSTMEPEASGFVELATPLLEPRLALTSGELEIMFPGGVSLRWKP
jgi:hypothetical protein